MLKRILEKEVYSCFLYSAVWYDSRILENKTLWPLAKKFYKPSFWRWVCFDFQNTNFRKFLFLFHRYVHDAIRYILESFISLVKNNMHKYEFKKVNIQYVQTNQNWAAQFWLVHTFLCQTYMVWTLDNCMHL